MPLRLAPSCKPPETGRGLRWRGLRWLQPQQLCALGCKSSEVVFILLLLETFRPGLQLKSLLRLRFGHWGTSPVAEAC